MIHQVPTSRAGVGRRLAGSYTRGNDRATHRMTVGRLAGCTPAQRLDRGRGVP